MTKPRENMRATGTLLQRAEIKIINDVCERIKVSYNCDFRERPHFKSDSR